MDNTKAWLVPSLRAAAGRAAELRAAPMTSCEDVAAAVCFLEHSKNTHENWAEWLADGKVASPDAGDLEHHRRCILEYEHVLDVIQADSFREGELMPALEMFWDYLGRSFDLEDKKFSVAEFEDKWGVVEEAEQEWEEKIPVTLAQEKKE